MRARLDLVVALVLTLAASSSWAQLGVCKAGVNCTAASYGSPGSTFASFPTCSAANRSQMRFATDGGNLGWWFCNGAAWARLSGTITGAGAANQLALWSGASTLTGSANFTNDGSNINVSGGGGFGIGSATPAANGWLLQALASNNLLIKAGGVTEWLFRWSDGALVGQAGAPLVLNTSSGGNAIIMVGGSRISLNGAAGDAFVLFDPGTAFAGVSNGAGSLRLGCNFGSGGCLTNSSFTASGVLSANSAFPSEKTAAGLQDTGTATTSLASCANGTNPGSLITDSTRKAFVQCDGDTTRGWGFWQELHGGMHWAHEKRALFGGMYGGNDSGSTCDTQVIGASVANNAQCNTTANGIGTIAGTPTLSYVVAGASPHQLKMMRLTTSATAAGNNSEMNIPTADVLMGGGPRLSWRGVYSGGTATVRYWAGLWGAGVATTDTPGNTMIGLRYSKISVNDATIQLCSNDAVTFSCVDTTVTPDTTNPHDFEIDCRTGTSCTMLYDGVAKVTKSTNMPGASTPMKPGWYVETNTTAVRTYDVGKYIAEFE